MCGGGRENEREGYGWVNKTVQKGYNSRVRVEQSDRYISS